MLGCCTELLHELYIAHAGLYCRTMYECNDAQKDTMLFVYTPDTWHNSHLKSGSSEQHITTWLYSALNSLTCDRCGDDGDDDDYDDGDDDGDDDGHAGDDDDDDDDAGGGDGYGDGEDHYDEDNNDSDHGHV